MLSIFLLLVTLTLVAHAQEAPDLTEMSLEDLLKLDVITTVGKRTQKLSRTPAAVYVISREEIERSGLTSVPEILRLAPGVEVAQVNSSAWAIAIRGFNGTLSNKLLVLVDGRTVYSSLFSQTLWAAQDLPLDNVERIEVVRGPGAAIWGANAVNGVINIVTRSAYDSQGTRLAAEAGSHDHGIASTRYGGKVNDDTAYRITARYALRGQLDSPGGDGTRHDRWDLLRTTFRADWAHSPEDSLEVNGDIYNADAGETIVLPTLDPPSNPQQDLRTTYGGGSLLFRWDHKAPGGSDTVWQVYYDRSSQVRASTHTTDNTLDFDFHQETHLGPRHDVLWGLGLRYIAEVTQGNFTLSFTPNDKGTLLFSGFVQDEISLLPDHLWLTLGTKLEHNSYTGVEVQPDVRILWSPTRRQSLWAAVSRAVRTPTGFERRGRASLSAFLGTGAVPNVLTIFGGPQTISEESIAYEAGYRLQATHKLSFDFATFYDAYRHLNGATPGTPFFEAGLPPPRVILPIFLNNHVHGHGWGAELSATCSPTRIWEIKGSWSWLRIFDAPDAGSGQVSTFFRLSQNPEHQSQVHSYLSLPHRIRFDTGAYYVAALRGPTVPSYTRVDAHLAWSATERLTLSSGLQNLLQPRHAEFVETVLSAVPEEIPRSFYGKLEWKF